MILLALGNGNFTFNGKCDAIGARHTQGSGITAYLATVSFDKAFDEYGMVRTYLARMACLLNNLQSVYGIGKWAQR